MGTVRSRSRAKNETITVSLLYSRYLKNILVFNIFNVLTFFLNLLSKSIKSTIFYEFNFLVF